MTTKTLSIRLAMMLLLLLPLSLLTGKTWAADYTYIYQVVDLSGGLATKAQVKQAGGSAPSIPTVIKNRLVGDGNYSYYTEDQFTISGNTYTLKDGAVALTTLPATDNTTIYVKYTYDNTTSAIDLSGNKIYYIKDTNQKDATKVHYLTFNYKYGSGDWRVEGSTNADANFNDNDKERHWFFYGNDPYKIYIGNVYLRDTITAINNLDITDSEKSKAIRALSKDNAVTGYYLRSDLAKGKFEDNNNIRFAGTTTDRLFNTFFFDSEYHIVAANNVYQWNNNTNKYIYLFKNGKDNYGDIGSRFFITGSGNLDLSKIYITSHEVWPVTVHIVNPDRKETFKFDTYMEIESPKLSDFHKKRLERLGATLQTTLYSDLACTATVTTLSTATSPAHVYIPYTFNSTTAETTALTNAKIVFSTEADPQWFSMICTRNGGKQMIYNSSTSEISSNQNSSDARAQASTGQFAFIGDPFSFRVITKGADGQYAYIDTGDNKKVRFSDTPEEWALVSGTDAAGGTFQIFRRDDFLSTYRAFWDAYNGGNQIRMTAQTSGTDDINVNRNIKATPTPKYTYTYNIVDKKGTIAIKYTIEQWASTRLDGKHGHEAIPEAIYSPYLKDETLTFYSTYTTPGTPSTLENDITATPITDKSNIYVRYSNALLSTRALPLDGSNTYTVKVGGKYVYYSSGVKTADGLPARTETAFNTYIWRMTNSDPYDVHIVHGTDYHLPNETDYHFILMKGKSDESNQVVLLKANGEDIATATNSQSLALKGEALVDIVTTDRTADAQQVVFNDASIEVHYRIIDKQGVKVVDINSKSEGDPALPAAWISPLVTKYHYYTRNNFTEAGGVYTLKSESETEINNVASATDGYVYVTYDVASDNKIISQVDPTAKSYRDDDPTLPKVRQYDTDYNTMFMIKFKNGESFYQEKSDKVASTATKAVYPYANGDAGFNIYGTEQWDEQKVAGSSTRTRWSWYLVSKYNDPYRLVVTSWQSSHARKMTGDNVNTTFYNYWRTYYNSSVGSVVTATTSDDPDILSTLKTGGSPDNAPTEYMLLGTTNDYKLVTANEIDGGVTAHVTYGKHRPVNSFLQYWKTYETISQKGALPYNEFKSQTDDPKSYFTAENVSEHPVYHFNAWHNARPITPSDPTKSNSKKYEYANHFYQNIQMGETFQLVEHTIDGILVLLDKHGWEITRKPMAKTGDANKATRDAAIRQFDSPMVKTYHFWGTATKTTGYHKYTRLTKKEGTGTSLTDYPEVINANGNISDVYVTYDVRPEYAELATVTATKDGDKITGVTTTVNTSTPFLIRQDGHLGYDDNGTLKKSGTLIPDIDAGNTFATPEDNFYWYLASNTDIDLEMGYVYDTGTKTDGKEDEDVNETSDGLYKPRTAKETLIAYYKTYKTGFDPYNIQIYNKATNNYLTTAISNSELDEYNAQKATFTDTNVTLAAHKAVNTAVDNGDCFDDTKLHMTNQTFMAVSDANGNMRIMPRFDRYNAVNDFGTLTAWADDQPEDDKAHAQTTWLLRPPAHTYIIVDHLGREAMSYTALSNGAPVIPAKYRSPLAKNYTFYKTLTGSGTPTVYDLTTLDNKIDSTFTAAGLPSGNVYVRYEYNPDADTDGILKGAWYNAKLNNGSADQDVKVTTGGIAKETFTNDAAHRWRFMDSAGDTADPYAVGLYCGTVDGSGHHVTESSGNRYILLKHSSGTGYALMKAGNTDHPLSKYLFLDGSSTPAITEQASYATKGTIADSKKLTLTPVVATTSLIYKIITNNKKLALSTEGLETINEGITASTKLADKMPDWLKSPLMKDDAYIFYSSADYNSTTGEYTVKGTPTTLPTTLDDQVVYVRYDYEKSKKAVTTFGMPEQDKMPYNYAPVDLSGKVRYTLGISSTATGRIWNGCADLTKGNETDVEVKNYNKLILPIQQWLFTGSDPYAVTLKNPAYNDTQVLSAKAPDTSVEIKSEMTEAEKAKRFPRLTMQAPGDATYKYQTFMVLRYNPKNVTTSNNKSVAGTLKLYVTGHDDLFVAESNSLAGGVYVYTDDMHYKQRLAATGGEPLNPIDNTMIVYSSFFYRPVLRYHVITDDGQKALDGNALWVDTKVELPEIFQSPLLNSSDFSYYTSATYDEGTKKWTVKGSALDANTTVATAATAGYGDIYVRYKYDPETSPYMIASGVNDAAEDGTRLDWSDEKSLDLSGNTWYTIANMQKDFSSRHGTLLATKTTTTFQKQDVNALTSGRAPSTKEYLWKLWGNDPYAIKITNGNCADDEYMTFVDYSSTNYHQYMQKGTGASQTFMLLTAHANDNELDDMGKDDEGEPKYKLRRWTTLIATGSQRFMRSTPDGSSLNSSGDWTFDDKGYSEYGIRQSQDKVVTRKILSMGSGGTTLYSIEFVKAPVSRKYHYHAIKYEGSTRIGETWDAVLEHDWLQPLVLEDVIARQFCKYEKRNTAATDENVTGTNEFMTRAELEAKSQPNAQFYRNEALTERVYDSGKNQYDIYPEIELEQVYHIWFKYQVDNDAKLSGRKLSDITSTPAEIKADADYYNGDGNHRMDQKYTRQAKWFFMVLDTDEGVTATGTGNNRTFTGRQLFLRREDDGTVNWMNNKYSLHKENIDNYKGWSYSRVAEWYRKGDNDAFREGRWLWTFVGDDPYNMRIVNFESAAGVNSEGMGVYALTGADNCYTTINKIATTNGATTYPITVPTSQPEENDTWGLCVGVTKSTEQTFSLLSTALTDTYDNQVVNTPLYWHMVSRTANKVTTESVEGMLDYIPDRSYAIQLLPYQPVKYEDVKLVIRRQDEVDTYKAAAEEAKPGILNSMTTGISKLYFAASERMYVEGDKISISTDRASETLPINVRRAFCNYKIYKSDTPFDDDTGTEYTVKAGPYPDYTKPKEGVFDEDGRQIYAYYNVDASGNFIGNEVTTGAQTIYASYEVTSDIFLKEHPDKDQVAAMADKNDHVYFMDFPDTSGKSTYHHAYYDPMSTMRERTGNLQGKTDASTGTVRSEKKKWDGSQFVDDKDLWYNHYQYRTAYNRMESVPENLKWYFVGDPYKMQVYCTAGDWNTETLKDRNGNDIAAGTVAANLCRFDDTETNFQFVVDCVHLRIPDYTNIDQQEKVYQYDESGHRLNAPIHNRHYNKPYFDDFYWECVPTTSDDEEAFALRFKEDNDLLGYRNVYYYLAHDGLKKTYLTNGDHVSYNINLSYKPDNEKHETGTYEGYHKANDVNTIIKLVQPVKVYVTAHRQVNENYGQQENVVRDELSEYYGLGETINGVPRHLQRKFVQYNDLTDKDGSTMGSHELTMVNATDSADCTHTSNVFVTETKVKKVNPVFKFTVWYTVSDLSTDAAGNDVHLFTTPAQLAAGNPQWVDMAVMGNGNNWLYFDKTQGDHTKVSDYRTAIGDNSADGWNDGLKGLHWALVGDPYDFTILNRRRYEDGNKTDVHWLEAVKTTTATDSVIWTTRLADYDDATPTAAHAAATQASAISEGTVNTHFSVQMWKLPPKNSDGTYKTGNADANYFLRTASLKSITDDHNNGSNENQTNNYWRMIFEAYPNATSTTSYFEMVPYSLSEKSTYSSTRFSENYSSTMSGQGVTQQRFEIRTAVAKDEDDADNNCFDADVEIRTVNGVLKLKAENMEIRYGDITNSLPVSLRRYGCTYRSYLYYGTENQIELTEFSELPNASQATQQEQYEALREALATAKAAGKLPLITYVYEMDSTTENFFTSEQDTKTEDYTWVNTYFNWLQSYSGTAVEREYYEKVFDHYVYNADGHIIDEAYRYERRVDTKPNPNEQYETNAFLNTHTNQNPVYADEGAQSEDDRQKWSLVGDPYSFTMKNYAQYLRNPRATVTLENNEAVTTNLTALAQNFALGVDAKGHIYLGVVDEHNVITKYMTFEYSNTSDKILNTTGTGTNLKDPTGNTIDTGGAKYFALTNLLRYADLLQYHLVIAHQYSKDATDYSTMEAEDKKIVDDHLYEFLKYRGLYEQRDSAYYVTYTDKIPTDTITGENGTYVKDLLKKYGTLRDLVNYPIADNLVERVGIGNRPQVPWYMKRQFCTYYCYQRDVLRSVVDESSPSWEIADQAWLDGLNPYVYENGVYYKTDASGNKIQRTFIENGQVKKAYNVMWVSIFDKSKWTKCEASDASAYQITEEDVTEWGESLKENEWRKMPSGYADAKVLNGNRLERLEECHFNRKVLIDVVYEVNTDQFRFADKGRNTTAWYQLMTNNERDGLMNFSYQKGIGAQQGRANHYTNDYLWAPEGDPYGFVLRSRYATINGTGWDDMAVTTTGTLPKEDDRQPTIVPEGLKADYTGKGKTTPIDYDRRKIVNNSSDGAKNAVYEMFIGSFNESFLMHPTAAWMDNSDSEHESYYMTHNTAGNTTQLTKAASSDLVSNADANWQLLATTSQLLPYFQRAGYVGGLQPLRALNFANEEMYNLLLQHNAAGTQPEFSLLNKAQELVYSGKFYSAMTKSEITDTDLRPGTTGATLGADELPLCFVSTNLVNLEPGYYRIKAFSEEALTAAEKAAAAEGKKGINGPRYVSGYRFASEVTGNQPLHFFETSKDKATIHTFADLDASTPFTASTPLQGNIEVLPADFDASSIFQFKSTTTEGVERFTLSTQDINVKVDGTNTKMVTTDVTPLRMNDIGGTAITMRTLSIEPTGSSNWDNDVVNTVKTNYLTSSGDTYSLSIGTNNELNETTAENAAGIHDTKWLLQPVGVKEEWPYNQMPLRVEVHQGGVKNQDLTGVALTAPENKDPYYYGTLRVPFDTRLQSTIDAAFTLVNAPTAETEKVTMQSVSQYNGMGNPQYVPATWPVVMRTKNPGSVTLYNEDGTTPYGTKYYVNMFLPYNEAQVVTNDRAQLLGKYLEQKLSTTDGKRVMVFGRPYEDHTEARGDAKTTHHQYNNKKQVGWYSNDNWDRVTYPEYRLDGGYPLTATVATDAQRSNKYVYHNRVYLVTDAAAEAESRHIVALFDGEQEEEIQFEEDRPIDEATSNVPWPCDVYDLQGRRVAENETPQTLRKNHPHLRKGVYIFSGHKVVVR